MTGCRTTRQFQLQGPALTDCPERHPWIGRLLSSMLCLSAITCVVGSAPERLRADPPDWKQALQGIEVQRLREHTHVLASDTYEGREAGSRGGKAAGIYVVSELEKSATQPGANNGYYQEFGTDYRNILGVLRGRDPELRDEYILVGAHYDHVGYGNRSNSFGPLGRIHNGADDNASGVSVVLELARVLGQLDPPPRRSIVFSFWDAEERGLGGSTHWVRHPTVPLRQIKLAINLDMVGRLRQQQVSIYGVRTAVGLRRLISECNRDENLELNFHWRIRKDSDHFPFYQARIPFLMPFTGKHPDYHRPTDDVDKLNVDGMHSLAKLALQWIRRTTESPEPLEFREQSASEDGQSQATLFPARPATPPRLGIHWQLGQRAEEGLLVTRVLENSAADRAGLRVGDQILKWGPFSIPGAFDLRSLVLATEDSATIAVRRGQESKPATLRIRLDGQPQRIGISWRDDPADPSVIVLTQVVPGSPAAVAGFQVQDRILSVDGTSIADRQAFLRRISRRQAAFEFQAERSGRLKSRRVVPVPEFSDPGESN